VTRRTVCTRRRRDEATVRLRVARAVQHSAHAPDRVVLRVAQRSSSTSTSSTARRPRDAEEVDTGCLTVRAYPPSPGRQVPSSHVGAELGLAAQVELDLRGVGRRAGARHGSSERTVASASASRVRSRRATRRTMRSDRIGDRVVFERHHREHARA
jgi:hypothetical protein